MTWYLIILVVALGWPLYRLFRYHRNTTTSIKQLNLAIFHERLTELKNDLATGLTSQEDFDEAKEELAAALLDDLNSSGAQKSLDASRTSKLLILAVCVVLIPLVTYFVFSFLQNKVQITDYEFCIENAHKQNETIKNYCSIVIALEKDPRNPELAMKLGHTFIAMGQYDLAISAYQRAREFGKDSSELLASMIFAYYEAQNGELTGEVEDLIYQAYAMYPDNISTMMWMGMLHGQQERYPESIELLEKVLSQLRPDSQQYQFINRLIAEARSRMNGEALPTASIRAHIELDKKLASDLKPDDTVFIFVKAAKGPPRPIVAIRKTVGELPLTVVLDDSNNPMSQQSSLGDYRQVMVTARISRSGQAMPQSGDLYGEAGPLDPNQTSDTVNITINKKLP